MKKLMVMLAGAAIAVSANAAVSFNWVIQSPIFDGTGSDAANAPAGLNAYLFCNDTTGSGSVITRSALVSALEGGVYESVADAWSSFGYGLASTTFTDPEITMGYTMVKQTVSGGEARGAAGGDDANFYAVIVDGDNLFFTDLVSASVQGNDATPVGFYNTYMNSQAFIDAADLATGSNGGWVTVAVPEPTSGLLLLLGVAGLALRRRRA